jgi:hypothetical protein
MSQFDLPRLNFSGGFSTDPATGNNNMHHPLLIFNPLTGQAYFPPRIYLEEKYVPPGSSLDKISACIPTGVQIKSETGPQAAGTKFIEINVINSQESFIKWARTPLGEYEVDRDFHDLYAALYAPCFRSSLTGLIVGYWNYYGTNYYHLHDVRVRSVTMEIDDKPRTFSGMENDCPEQVIAFLDARLTYNAIAEDDSTNSAKMVDTLPVMNVYTQIFSDWLTLYKDKKTFFRGHPNKGSVRNVNVFRVINENMPYSGAGKIITTISLSKLQKKSASPLIKFFRKYGDPNRKINGIYIQQVLSEVEERRPMDYQNLGNVSNPAFGTLSGVIAPWYEGEMRSWTIGRQLEGDQPFLTAKSNQYDIPVSTLSPAIFRISPDEGRLDIDLSVNIPMLNTKEGGPQIANPYENNQYETYDLGQIDFIFEKTDRFNNPVDQLRVGSLTIDKSVFPREKFLKEGGIFSLFFKPVRGLHDMFSGSNLAIYGLNEQGEKIRLMKENPDVIISDETGLYCDQNDDPAKGYRTYTGVREPCRIRIFRYGKAVTEETAIFVLAYKIGFGGAEMQIEPLRTARYKDGDIITFPTHEPSSTIYQFFSRKPIKILPSFYPAMVVRTGFMVNVRVLPYYDFSKYLNPEHEKYQGPVTFEILLKEIFASYNLLYPTMNFSEHSWDNESMAKYLHDRIKLESWEKPWYMPVSRDLSESQRLLIESWIGAVLKGDKLNFSPGEDWESENRYLTTLPGQSFFRK